MFVIVFTTFVAVSVTGLHLGFSIPVHAPMQRLSSTFTNIIHCIKVCFTNVSLNFTSAFTTTMHATEREKSVCAKWMNITLSIVQDALRITKIGAKKYAVSKTRFSIYHKSRLNNTKFSYPRSPKNQWYVYQFQYKSTIQLVYQRRPQQCEGVRFISI